MIDSVTDLLDAIIADAQRARAVNARIASDDLDDRVAFARRSDIRDRGIR